MIDKKELISKLKYQHRVLLEDLSLASGESGEKNGPGSKVILGALEKFKKDLEGHLEFENDVFYAELLKEMERDGYDTSKTKMFILEMRGIEKDIRSFLEKYRNEADIGDNISEFRKDLLAMTEAVKLRIESEESGVFRYWDIP